MISEVLIHHLDTMRYLCGPLRVVAARTLHSVDVAKGETCAAIFLETAAGRPVDVTGTMAAPGFPPRASDRLELIGSKASLVFDDFELRLLGDSPRHERFDGTEGYQASFDAVIAHFVDCLHSGGRSKPIPPTTSRPCAWSSMPTLPPASRQRPRQNQMPWRCKMDCPPSSKDNPSATLTSAPRARLPLSTPTQSGNSRIRRRR